MRPNFNLAAVDAATETAIEAGHRIFQTCYYGDDDQAHVDILLDYLRPLPPSPVIVDAGCGIGEVSRLMARRLPTAMFYMVNLSMKQLRHCPEGFNFQPVYGDCHELSRVPHIPSFVDAIMFSSALCQMDAPVVLAECRKMLRMGGALLLNELLHPHGHPPVSDLLETQLACRVLDSIDLVGMLAANGFAPDSMTSLPYDDSHFRAMLQDAGMESALDNTIPCVIRATKVA